MSLPAVRAVRERFRTAEIVALARPWVADLYACERAVDRVMPFECAGGLRDFGAKWKLAERLREEHFDWAILLPNSFEAALIARLAAIPRRVGYARDRRGWLLTDPIQPPEPGDIPRHQRFYYLELLRRSGLLERLPGSTSIRMESSDQAAAAGITRLRDVRLEPPVIGVSPGAAYGNAKRWLPERFAEAARHLARTRGASVALFGSAGERGLCENVAACIGSAAPVHNFAGETSLRQFIEAAAACRVFLTNDSGAMHIASALGVPTVAIFGATDDTATGPAGPLVRVIREPVECSPCLLRECPIDHRCMTSVAASRVVAAADELWRESEQ